MNEQQRKRQRQRLKQRQAQRAQALAIKQNQRPAPTPTAPNPRRKNRRPSGPHVPQPLPLPDDIKADEYNKECYIVGGGPSLIGFDWKNLDGKFVIGINRAYEILPDAQIIYFTDDDYWIRHQGTMTQHKGKLYRGRLARKRMIKDQRVVEIQLQPTPAGWSDTYGEAHHGSNSSYACIQLAAQLGFTTIYLLGVDMKHQGNYLKKNKNNRGVTHWHTGHRRTDPATAYKMMIGNYAKLAPLAKERNINIINVNTPEGTNLTYFPIKPFKEIFGK